LTLLYRRLFDSVPQQGRALISHSTLSARLKRRTSALTGIDIEAACNPIYLLYLTHERMISKTTPHTMPFNGNAEIATKSKSLETLASLLMIAVGALGVYFCIFAG
jgi:hypothetical protein